MHNAELDYTLESAYEDGYYQALADMGYEFDDESSYDDAEEDVDIFDENYFDDASEGAAREYRHRVNEGRSANDIRNERAVRGRKEVDRNTGYRLDENEFYGRRHNTSVPEFARRESYLASNRGAPILNYRTKQGKAAVARYVSDKDYARRATIAGSKAGSKFDERNADRFVRSTFADSKGEASRIIHK